MNDVVRASLIALLTSILNAAVIVGVIDIDSNQQATLDLVITNAIIFAALIFKKGQQAG